MDYSLHKVEVTVRNVKQRLTSTAYNLSYLGTYAKIWYGLYKLYD